MMNEVNNILRDFQYKYEFLINSITDVIIEVDLDGTFTYASPQVYDMFGYKPEEIIEKKFFNFIHPDDLPTITGVLSEAIKSNEIFSLEYRVRHKKGHYVPISARGSLVKVKDKLKLIEILRDITEKKLAEHKLIESEEKFRSITEQSLLGILILQDGTIKYANERLSKILGYSIQEITKMSINELFKIIHPDDRAIVMERLKKKQSEELIDSQPYLIRMFNKSGELRWFDGYSKLIQYQGKNAILANIIDITDKNSVEKKLKKSEENYHLLFNKSPDYIYITDTEGIILDANETLLKRVGLSREAYCGLNSLDFFVGNNQDDLNEALSLIRDGKEVKGLEFRAKTASGEIFEYEIDCVPLKEDGQITEVLNIARDITGRKEAEQKLKDEKEKAQKYLDIAGVILLVLNADQTIQLINRKGCEILEEKESEIIGINWIDKYIPEKNREIVKKEYNRFINGEIELFEYSEESIIIKNDEERIIAWHNKALKNKAGEIIGTISSGQDITEYKKGEQKLKEPEEKYRILVEQSLQGIIIIQDMKIVFANSAMAEILGYSVEELLCFSTEEVIKLIHLEDKTFVLNRHKDRMEGRTVPNHYEYRIIRKDNTIRTIELYATVIEYEGKIASQQVFIDITERKEAERKLKETEKKYHELFENSPSSILIIDLTGIIVDCNYATEVVTGYDKKDLLGNSFTDFSFFNKDTLKKVMENFNLLVTSKEIHRLEILAKNKDGTPIWIMIRGSLVSIEEKNLIQVIFHDITERKNVERELMEISRLKSELLIRTSHELKTPIISIRGFTDLLLDLHKEKFDDDTISILGEIKEGTNRLASIINKLLETSYLESRQVQLNPTKEDLMFLIKFCVKDLRGLAKTRNHFIHLSILDTLKVIIEKEKIYDVISHLIINAIKYTPPYGEIKIESKIINNFIIISVEDNGIGLTDDDQKKIFKRFGKIERYGQGWDVGIEGTGMGLYTAKKSLNCMEEKSGQNQMEKIRALNFIFPSLPFKNNLISLKLLFN